MSQFFHGLHTHQTCHTWSTFGMLWIDVLDSVFQFPPLSINSIQPLESGTTFHRPQSTAWSTLCESVKWLISLWIVTHSVESLKLLHFIFLFGIVYWGMQVRFTWIGAAS
jgi:hypothetical protein